MQREEGVASRVYEGETALAERRYKGATRALHWCEGAAPLANVEG